MPIFCNFLQFLCSRISATYVPWNDPKTLKNAYFQPFSQKNCNFLQKNVSFWSGHMSAYLPWFRPKWLNSLYFQPFSAKNWKKLQFLCTSILAHMSRISAMIWGKNPVFPLFCSLFLKKLQFFAKKCQFLCTMCQPICPIISHKFGWKVLISSILSTFLWKSSKKLQFFAHFLIHISPVYVP